MIHSYYVARWESPTGYPVRWPHRLAWGADVAEPHNAPSELAARQGWVTTVPVYMPDQRETITFCTLHLPVA